MGTISANELKKGGISALVPVLERDGEVVITVRGKGRYVVMTVEKYNRLRESELAEAVREARADYRAGRVHDEGIEEHIRRITDNR